MIEKLSNRNQKGCVICGAESFKREYGLISPFFAERVLGQSISAIIEVLQCTECNSRFFNAEFSEDQLGKLYKDYRGLSYFEQRNKFEPWYTKKINDNIGSNEEFKQRQKTCLEALGRAHVKNDFSTALDHGGDRGQMLSGDVIYAKRKAVFEISGVEPEKDVERVSYKQLKDISWDFILSCHVLEHLTNPTSYVDELISLGHKGTVYFFEVPKENYSSFSINGTWIQSKWLNWLRYHALILRSFHFMSVAFRRKLKIVPPFLFPALNEHLNIFSVQGLYKLLEKNGLVVKYVGIGSSGHITAVAVKN